MAICLGAAVLAAVLLAGCGGGGGNDTTPPIVTSFTVTPTTLEFPGGTVALAARVSDQSEVVAVSVSVHSSSETDTVVTMTNTGGNAYSGHFAVPPNTNSDGTTVYYSASLTATDAMGNSTGTEPVTVAVAAPDTPPNGPESP